MFELATPLIPVNSPEHDVALTREQVWNGLVWKAQYPTLFVSPILECEILETFDDGFLRHIRHITADGSEWIMERVFLEPMQRVTFLRLSGGVLGRIVNEIFETEAGIALQFRFTLALAEEEHGSPAELAYREQFAAGYIAAVDATLAATRDFARTGVDPTTELVAERAKPTG